MFGLPGLEHENFVGSRGRGVTPNPATMLRVCPQQAPQCQPAPNRGQLPPTLTSVRQVVSEVTITGTLNGAPSSRYLVELFANSSLLGESEQLLDDTPVLTDQSGVATFSLRVDRSRLAGMQCGYRNDNLRRWRDVRSRARRWRIKPSSRRLESQ